jgi:MFS transporter, DHA1 family, inner membrane transport protein
VPVTAELHPGPDRDSVPYGVLLVMATAVLVAITTELLPVGLLPVIGRDLHASDSRTGLLVSAYALVVAVGAVPAAAVSARWPRRRVLGLLLLTYAASNALMAAAPDYAVALVARLIGGVAHAGFFTTIFAAAIAAVPRSRSGRAIAFVSSGSALGLCLGVPLGTALGTAAGWRWAFVGCAVAMALLSGLVTVALPEEPTPAAGSGAATVQALGHRPLLLIAATTVVLTLGLNTTYTYVSPILLYDGVALGHVSLVLAGYGLAGVVGVVVAGLVADRRPQRGLSVAIGLAAACLLLLGLSRHGSTSVPVIIAWGACFGALPALTQAVALRTVPKAPDVAMGVINSTFNIGIAGGAFLGARELMVAQPPTLALTGAALVVLSLIPLAAPALRDGRPEPERTGIRPPAAADAPGPCHDPRSDAAATPR